VAACGTVGFQQLKPSKHFGVDFLKKLKCVGVVGCYRSNARTASKLGEPRSFGIDKGKPRLTVGAQRRYQRKRCGAFSTSGRTGDQKVNSVAVFREPNRGTVVRLSDATWRVIPLDRAKRIGEQYANFA
jgi:hypothetical protein